MTEVLIEQTFGHGKRFMTLETPKARLLSPFRNIVPTRQLDTDMTGKLPLTIC